MRNSSTATDDLRALKSLDRRALNPLRHAGFSKAVLLPGEDAEQRAEIEREYIEAFHPTTRPAHDTVLDLVNLRWRLNRLDKAEESIRDSILSRTHEWVPTPIMDLEREVHDEEVELRILSRLSNSLTELIDSDESRTARNFLTSHAPILDLLLNWRESVADIEPPQAAQAISNEVGRRTAAVEATRKMLNRLVEVSRISIEAAKADALLDSKQLARIRQERTTISRRMEKGVKFLREIQTMSVIEGQFKVSAGRSDENHETNFSGIPYGSPDGSMGISEGGDA